MRRLVPWLAVAVLALGCDRKPAAEPPRPPIVLISIDTLRSDWLPGWGGGAVETPAIDRLAADGILFERAFANVPLTLPSHVSMLSGLLPPRHGVRDNLGFPVDAGRTQLLQGRLSTLGYQTMGAISAVVLARRTGIAEGFDAWSEPAAGQQAAPNVERPGAETLAAAVGWLEQPLERSTEQPRFLFLHLYEPHLPYRPPEPFLSRLGATYAAEIAAADALVAQLIEALERNGMYSNALVILTSDHGEGLGDHQEDEHGLLLYREALQVPLVVKLPGNLRAGERIADNVSLVDVVPTVLEVVGAPSDATVDGRSLLGANDTPRPLYAETMYPLLHFGWSPLAAVIAGDLHLIDGPGPELYDFVADPGEHANLLATGAVTDRRRELSAMRSFLDGIDRALAAPETANPEALANLAALGYLGQPSIPADRDDLPNPRDRVAAVRPLLEGVRLYHERKLELAAERLRAATEAEDGRAQAWRYLADVYRDLGRVDEALAAYRESLGPDASAATLELAARTLLEAGQPATALQLLELELTRAVEPAARATLGALASRALLQLGRREDARRAASAAVEAAPGLGDAYYQRAVVAIAERDVAAAEGDLERAIALDSRHLPARKALAMLRHASGDSEAAARLLEEVLRIEPGDLDAREGLAALQRSR